MRTIVGIVVPLVLLAASASSTFASPGNDVVAIIEGNVTDASGAPVAGAEIVASVAGRRVVERTDAQGRFSVMDATLSDRLIVSKPGFATWSALTEGPADVAGVPLFVSLRRLTMVVCFGRPTYVDRVLSKDSTILEADQAAPPFGQYR